MSPEPVELSERIFSVANNILCKIAFGKSYEGRQFESGKFKATIDETVAMLSSFWGSDFFPYVGWILDVLSGRQFRLEKLFYELDGFYETIIEDHAHSTRRKSHEHEDITDILLGLAKDETTSVHLTRDHIKAILMNIFIGGIDTSAVTIVWAMSELARNPRVMQKVQAEIRSHVGKNPKVYETQVESLKYLKVVEFMLANLLHCFDWELPKGMKPEDISLEEEGGLVVHRKLPLYLVPVEYKWQDYKS